MIDLINAASGHLTTAIAFVAVFGLLIFVHELGHFVTAKRAGVLVYEFGFGFPPRLFAFRRGETEYSLNVIPLGGFVRMEGEEDPSHPRSLAAKGVRTRLLILAAGGLMNAGLAFSFFILSFMVPQDVVLGQVQIQEVAPGSPAEQSGLRLGDVIVRVNDRVIRSAGDLSYNIHLNLGKETTIYVREGSAASGSRGAQAAQRVITVVPRWNPPAGQGATGIRIGLVNPVRTEQAYPVWEAVPMGLRKGADIITLAKNDIQGMFSRESAPAVAGPIGIYQMTGEVAKFGWGALVDFTAILSLNLAIINLLPFPPLDGGKIAFVALEGIRRGKRIPVEKEILAGMVGMFVLIGLILLVSYYDIQRILTGGGALP